MAEKVKLSKDGSSIDFVASENIPTSLKKFRQSPEIEGFYRFIYENDLQKEAFEILDRIVQERKRKKAEEKARDKASAKAAAQLEAPVPQKLTVKTAGKIKAVAGKPAAPVKAAESIAKTKPIAKTGLKASTKPAAKAPAIAKPSKKLAAKPAAKAKVKVGKKAAPAKKGKAKR